MGKYIMGLAHKVCVVGAGGGGGGKRKELINIEDVLISFIHVSICDRNKSSIFVWHSIYMSQLIPETKGQS